MYQNKMLNMYKSYLLNNILYGGGDGVTAMDIDESELRGYVPGHRPSDWQLMENRRRREREAERRRQNRLVRSQQLNPAPGPRFTLNEPGVSLQYFPFSVQNIAQFTRDINKPTDCVLNALVILSLIPPEVGALLRHCEFSDNGGIPSEAIANIMNILAYDDSQTGNDAAAYDFQETNSVEEFIELIDDNLPKNSATIAGLRRFDGSAHAITIAKNDQNQIFMIDPHMPFGDDYACNLADYDCSKYLVEGTAEEDGLAIVAWSALLKMDPQVVGHPVNPYVGSPKPNFFARDNYGNFSNLMSLQNLFTNFFACTAQNMNYFCMHQIAFPGC